MEWRFSKAHSRGVIVHHFLTLPLNYLAAGPGWAGWLVWFAAGLGGMELGNICIQADGSNILGAGGWGVAPGAAAACCGAGATGKNGIKAPWAGPVGAP